MRLLGLRTLQWWGLMPYDLLSNLISTDDTPAHLGFNAFECLRLKEFAQGSTALALYRTVFNRER